MEATLAPPRPALLDQVNGALSRSPYVSGHEMRVEAADGVVRQAIVGQHREMAPAAVRVHETRRRFGAGIALLDDAGELLSRGADVLRMQPLENVHPL